MNFEVILPDDTAEKPVQNTGLSGCGQPGIISRPDLWGIEPKKEKTMKDNNGVEIIGRKTHKVCLGCGFNVRPRTLAIQGTETHVVVMACPNSGCTRFGLVTLAVGESEKCLVCPPKAPGYVQNPRTKVIGKCPSCNYE